MARLLQRNDDFLIQNVMMNSERERDAFTAAFSFCLFMCNNIQLYCLLCLFMYLDPHQTGAILPYL